MSEKIRVAVVEDEHASANELKGFLDRFAAEKGCAVESVRFENGDSFLQAGGVFDVIFMDIEMPGSDGLSVVKKLREKDKDVLVFFVTGLAQYAVSGYEVQAFDFIVKPVNYYGFAMKFARAAECLEGRRKREVWVTSRQGKKLVTADRLKYVEVMRHTLIYHTLDGNVTGTGTLKSVISVFEGLPFSLCNQCYYINLKYVTEVNGFSVRVGGDVIQISAPKKKDFLRDLNNYLASGGRT